MKELTKEDWDRFEKEAEIHFESFILMVPEIDIKDAYISGYKMGSAEQYKLKK